MGYGECKHVCFAILCATSNDQHFIAPLWPWPCDLDREGQGYVKVIVIERE